MPRTVFEICKTCCHAQDAEELTRAHDLHMCAYWLADFRDNCPPMEWALVKGESIGCLDGYQRDQDAFTVRWSDEEAERAVEAGKSLDEINGVRRGVDYPASLPPDDEHTEWLYAEVNNA